MEKISKLMNYPVINNTVSAVWVCLLVYLLGYSGAFTVVEYAYFLDGFVGREGSTELILFYVMMLNVVLYLMNYWMVILLVNVAKAFLFYSIYVGGAHHPYVVRLYENNRYYLENFSGMARKGVTRVLKFSFNSVVRVMFNFASVYERILRPKAA